MDHRPMGNYLEQGETIEAKARAGDNTILVTDRRLVIEGDGRRLIDIPVDGLRRIQFDIEKRRPATLVFVPESVEHQPQVLTVSAEQYQEVGSTLAVIGVRLERVSS